LTTKTCGFYGPVHECDGHEGVAFSFLAKRPVLRPSEAPGESAGSVCGGLMWYDQAIIQGGDNS
jgi:hypothetical protein